MTSGRSAVRAGGRATWSRRVLMMAALAVAFVIITAQSAVAHVLLDRANPNGDGTTTLTFSFDHGCEGQPTDQLNFIMPPGVEVLDTGEPAGWSAVIEGSQVNWTGDPIPDGMASEFELIASITGVPGQAFVFPVVQSCSDGGQYAWTDTDPGSTRPAPSFIATAATLSEPAAQRGSNGASTVQALVSIGVAAVVLGMVGVVLTRRRRLE